MALQVSTKKRIFEYNKELLTDPNPLMTPSEVAKFYSAKYPELINASIKGPQADGENVKYSFERNVGTKG